MPETQAVAAAVAHNTRRLRTARGWSLDTLAARSGVSKGMLVQLEAARTNPSIGTLCKVAEALHISLAGLVEVEAAPTVRVVAAGDGIALWRGAAGGVGELLVGADEPAHVELWEWRLEPGDRHGADAHADGTLELLHVLGGTLTLEVDGLVHALPTGAAAGFRADRPHEYRNNHRRTARFTMVILQTDADFDAWSAARADAVREDGGDAAPLAVPGSPSKRVD